MATMTKTALMLTQKTSSERQQTWQIKQRAPAKKRKMLFPDIVKLRGVCGGSACIVRTRIPVWSVIEWQQMGCSTAKILKIYPTLTASDILSAENYYSHNITEIEREIQENREA
ncbi:MAG: DUF433 domain-containing protein [Candidatus Kapabacteria bacterium]|jgi:uncharacterized protein (DUF433 family)|nr:DUF433 domain-containing protein [Candidatus Kapabacteria bacterium]